MNVQLSHTIVRCSDKRESAVFLAEILGLPDPSHLGSMLEVLAAKEGTAASQHDAFLVSEEEFDQVADYLRDGGRKHRPEIYRHDGRRSLYFKAPSGQVLEVMTHLP